MKGIVVLAVLAALAGGAVYLVGASLPVAHVAERSRWFGKSPPAVEAAIADPTLGASDFELVERTPARIVTRVKPGKPYGGTWTWELKPDKGGTLVAITERGEIYNPAFRFFSHYIFGQTSSLDGALSQLGKRLGE